MHGNACYKYFAVVFVFAVVVGGLVVVALIRVHVLPLVVAGCSADSENQMMAVAGDSTPGISDSHPFTQRNAYS